MTEAALIAILAFAGVLITAGAGAGALLNSTRTRDLDALERRRQEDRAECKDQLLQANLHIIRLDEKAEDSRRQRDADRDKIYGLLQENRELRADLAALRLQVNGGTT